jgi:rhodanese-related sulfurtransferase
MSIKQAEPPQAHEMLKSNPDAIYLDVRTEAEFAQGHPAGAINVPVVFIKGPGQMELNGEFVDVVA